MCGFLSLLSNLLSWCGIYVMYNINSDLDMRVRKLEKKNDKKIEKPIDNSWFSAGV